MKAEHLRFPIQYLPVKDFPPLPGEKFIEKRRKQGNRKRLTTRYPKRDFLLKAVKSMYSVPNYTSYDRFNFTLSPRQLESTLRKEISSIYKLYGPERVTTYGPPFRGRTTNLVTVTSPPITLKDEDGKDWNLGRFDVRISVTSYPKAVHWNIHAIPLEPVLSYVGESHPHVFIDGRPCLGDGEGRVFRAFREGYLSDVVRMMMHHLQTYNPQSPTRYLRSWTGKVTCGGCGRDIHISHEYVCHECNVRRCSNCIPRCPCCGRHLCKDDTALCPSCGRIYCSSCQQRHYRVCPTCRTAEIEARRQELQRERARAAEAIEQTTKVLGWAGSPGSLTEEAQQTYQTATESITISEIQFALPAIFT